MTARIRTFDFESALIEPGNPYPPAVCMSHCEIVWDYAAGRWVRTVAEVLTWRDGIALLWTWLEAGDCFVGANVSFDIGVSVFSDLRDPEGMMRLWVNAYNADRVTDVQLRQTLLDLSVGKQAHSYSLDNVCKALGTATTLDKECEWRLRFFDLSGLPVEAYPAEALEYSRSDAEATAEAWILQEQLRAYGSPYFPGMDPLADQYRQARGAMALSDISAAGLRTDRETVDRFRAWAEEKRDALQPALLEAGLIRTDYKTDWAAVKASGLLPLTPAGNPRKGRALLASHPDPRIRALLDVPASYPYLHEHGFATRKWVRDSDAVQARIVAAFAKQGRQPMLASTEVIVDGKKVLRESIRTDADACTQSLDPILKDYSEFSAVTKLLSTDFQILEAAKDKPFHAFYRPLQSTGRTSTGAEDDDSAKGNVQNLPRRPGVRECYCPRAGNVFIDADYSALELHTFAQVCFWKLGWSNLGDMLNTFDPPLPPQPGDPPGLVREGSWHDVHLEGAAALLNITYDEARLRKAREDKDVDKNRTAYKGVNFGRKGVMGASRFVMYAWNNYKVDLSDGKGPAAALAKSKELIALHDRLTPEFPAYSSWVKSHVRPGTGGRDSVFDLVHPWSLRLRAGLFFSDAHNYPFQGLAGDLTKLAAWLLFCARWGCSERGKADPLYRERIVLFTHDSFTGEVSRAKANAAAVRLGEVMEQAARIVLPNVPSRADPCVMTRLSKDAKPRYAPAPVNGVNGGRELTPWDPWDEARKKVSGYLREKGLTVPLHSTALPEFETWLAKKGLPPFIASDMLTETNTGARTCN